MKLIISSLAMALVTASALPCSADIFLADIFLTEADLPQLFHKPIILGASVSSGEKTLSPGDRASRKYTAPANIRNIAKSGKKGASYTNITAALFRGHSIILAIDFLFWDSTVNAAAGIQAANNLIQAAAEAGVPLILGDLPPLLPHQFSRPALNQHIRASCLVANGCHVLKFDALHRVASNEGVLINGKRHFYYPDLTVDGVHPNAVGAEYIAEMLVTQMSTPVADYFELDKE